MYIETSIPRVPGDKAWLSSPVIPQMSNTICLSFYYYMYGEDVGTLNVIIRSIDSGSVSSPLWSVFGEKGDFWLKGQIAINVSSDSEVQYEYSDIVAQALAVKRLNTTSLSSCFLKADG